MTGSKQTRITVDRAPELLMRGSEARERRRVWLESTIPLVTLVVGLYLVSFHADWNAFGAFLIAGSTVWLLIHLVPIGVLLGRRAREPVEYPSQARAKDEAAPLHSADAAPLKLLGASGTRLDALLSLSRSLTEDEVMRLSGAHQFSRYSLLRLMSDQRRRAQLERRIRQITEANPRPRELAALAIQTDRLSYPQWAKLVIREAGLALLYHDLLSSEDFALLYGTFASVVGARAQDLSRY